MTDVEPGVFAPPSSTIGSPYYTCGTLYNKSLHGVLNLSGMGHSIINEVTNTSIPFNIVLSKRSLPTNQNVFKAQNNIYLGNMLNIIRGPMMFSAGNNIVLEPGTQVVLPDDSGAGSDIIFEPSTKP